jgi:hypothetical protein
MKLMRLTASGLLAVSLLALSTFSACTSGPPKPKAEAPPPTYQSTPESATPATPSVVMAPTLPEVQTAIKRVFKDAAVLNPNRSPNFFSGDFNGDNSKDLVVILKPVNIEEMNRQFAPWLVRDPRSKISTRERPPIQKDETLLAVIHGFGNNDWRDPDATQTFLLKNVVGNDMKVQTGKEFAEANSGRKLPRAQGDLIGETIDGTQGYLYYAFSNYSWYDPKTFKENEGVPGPFHKARMR